MLEDIRAPLPHAQRRTEDLDLDSGKERRLPSGKTFIQIQV